MRPIHPDFLFYLEFKESDLITLFKDLRTFVLDLYPDSNELIYQTHALTSVFSISLKLSDAFCIIPIYTAHLNLGFNKGSLLDDPHGLLTGTGKLMRHIPVRTPKDYRNRSVETLLKKALELANEDMDEPSNSIGETVSKIKM